jgi:hypothetical protein
LLLVACQAGLVAPPPPDAGSAASSEGADSSARGGVGKVIGSFPGSVDAVTMDDTYLYASEFGAIYRLRRDGVGGAHLLAKTSSFNPGIVVDDTNVYWTDLCGPDVNCAQGEVQSVPKAGGPVTTLASAQLRPESLVADETHLYWTNEGHDGPGEPFGGGQVVSMPKTGGTPLVLVDNLQLADSLVLDGRGGAVFHAFNIIGRVPTSGGAQTTLENVLNGFGVSNFVVAGTELYYWTGDTTGPLYAVATNTNDTAAPSVGPSATVVAPSVSAIMLANVGTTLFWLSEGGDMTRAPVGEIWAMNLADGSTSVFAASDPPDATNTFYESAIPAGLVADARGVFALEYRGGTGVNETIVRAFPLQ